MIGSQCNKVAATIIDAGHAVFSQVSMSHPINLAFEGKDNAAIGKPWAPVDAVFMDVMQELIILDLPGWDISSGIKREIECFKGRGAKGQPLVAGIRRVSVISSRPDRAAFWEVDRSRLTALQLQPAEKNGS